LSGKREPLTTRLDDLFVGTMIDEAMLRRYIERVKAQFPKSERTPEVLPITALAVGCERLLDAFHEVTS
jgi:hypothetical protein